MKAAFAEFVFWTAFIGFVAIAYLFAINHFPDKMAWLGDMLYQGIDYVIRGEEARYAPVQGR